MAGKEKGVDRFKRNRIPPNPNFKLETPNLTSDLSEELYGDKVTEIDVDKITESPYQCRVKFDENLLKELSDNISQFGLINAITVREIPGGYELIAGERRLRAVKTLGWRTITASVIEADDQKAAYLSFSENFSRKNLSEYECYNFVSIMTDKFGKNQNEIAQEMNLGKSRVSQIVSVGKLPEDVIERIIPLKLAAHHIRALRLLQKHNTDLMYRLLSELEEQFTKDDKKIIDGPTALNRAKELIASSGIKISPAATVTNDFNKRLVEFLTNRNRYTPEQWVQIMADMNRIKESLDSFFLSADNKIAK